jgi:hypothetical protein
MPRTRRGLDLMPFAAFRHHTSRDGFEVVFTTEQRFEGHITAIFEGQPYALRYAIDLDEQGRTRRAEVVGHRGMAVLEGDGAGRWVLDGRPAPALDGVLDVDLEASAVTNAFPVARGATDAPAAWVRFGLTVERLEQTYTRIGERSYDYVCPRFDFRAEIVYGEDGLVLEYPGIATRAAG